MDTAQRPEQGIGVVKVPMEEGSIDQRKAERPQKPQAFNCPRCNSGHTKFCYYNNYSLSQPRYFCKTCRRYWTEGGSLRNVPVGGGSRKNNNKRSSSPSLSKNIKLLNPDHHLSTSSQNPNYKTHGGQDLNLAYPPTTGCSTYNSGSNISEFVELPPYSSDTKSNYLPNTATPSSTTTSISHHHLSAMELLKSGIAASRGGFSSFLSSMPLSHDPNNNIVYSSASALPNYQEFKPSSLNFSLDHGFETSTGYGGLKGVQESNSHARLFFPFEELKPVSTTTDDQLEQNNRRGQGDQSTGYWNIGGGLGGGGSW